MQTYKIDGLTRHQWVSLYQSCAAQRLHARLNGHLMVLSFCDYRMKQIQSNLRLMQP